MVTESVVSNVKKCYFCRQIIGLHRHHVFFGNPGRRISEAEGCWVWLCHQCHNTSSRGVHNDRRRDLLLKQATQAAWMRVNGKTAEDFRRRFGKNYI